MLSLLKRKLNAYLRDVVVPATTDSVGNRVIQAQRRDWLLWHTLHDTTPGVNREDGQKVVISLTTHGHRLHEAYLAIESIMQGTVLPCAIELWIGEEEAGKPLPVTLQRQVARGLQVIPTRDMRSYTKIVPALRKHEGDIIVTIDDDILYPHDFLENLLTEHTNHPDAIVANMVMQLSRDQEGIPVGILDWPYITDSHTASGNDLFFEGFGGVLYPPKALPEETLDEATFLRLSPTADDVWLNAMARLNGTPIRLCNRPPYDFVATDNPACKPTSLNKLNNAPDHQNDLQIRRVWEHFHLQNK